MVLRGPRVEISEEGWNTLSLLRPELRSGSDCETRVDVLEAAKEPRLSFSIFFARIRLLLAFPDKFLYPAYEIQGIP